MKKIMCLIDGLHQGGAERQMIGLVSLLMNVGYNVDLVTYNGDGFYSSVIEETGINCIVINVNGSKWSKYKAVKDIFLRNHGYDCVIAYKISPAIIACILKMFVGGFKLIVSERNTTQRIGMKEKVRFFLYKWADYIVPNSYSQKGFIERNYNNLINKVRVITNFTDVNYFVPKSKQVGGTIQILTTARISRQKNLLNFLNAIKILKERHLSVHFDWYGNVQTKQEDYADQVYHICEEYQLQDIITFHPATNNILDKYQECDIFCLPSVYEGFPNVVCEAMSCGKPIVCSRVCDNSYLVKDGNNGYLFDPLNPIDIANVIQKMCELSEDSMVLMGEKSRTMAIDLFSENAFVNKYINLIEN